MSGHRAACIGLAALGVAMAWLSAAGVAADPRPAVGSEPAHGGPGQLDEALASDAAAFTLVAQIGGRPADVVADAEQVYFAAGSSVVVAVAAPEDSLRVVAVSPLLPAPIERLALRGEVLWVADGPGGLWALALHGRARPTVLGHVDLPGTALDVAVEGERAFVAAGELGGLRFVDVRDPTLPRLVGGLDTPGSALGVAAVGSVAYLADGASGLMVVDAADPAHPQQSGTVPSGIHADAVAVRGNVLLVMDGPVGLRTLDLSSPSAVELRGTVLLEGRSTGLLLTDTLAYVLSETGASNTTVSYIDITTPNVPQIAAHQELTGRDKRGMARFGKLLLVGSGNNGRVTLLERLPADKAVPTAPWVALLLPQRVLRLSGDPGQSVVGTASETASSRIDVAQFAVDLADPAQFAPAGWIPTFLPGPAVVGNHAYVLDQSDKRDGKAMLLTFDVTYELRDGDPVYLDQPYSSEALLVPHGNMLFLALPGSITPIDVSNPQRPVVGQSSDLAVTLHALAMDGDLAVGLSSGRLTVLSIRPVSQVQVLAELAAQVGANDKVSVRGGQAVFTAGQVSIGVLDLADPAVPRLTRSFASTAQDVALGPHLLLVIAGRTLRAIDLTADPPREIGHVAEAYLLRAVRWVAGHAVVGTEGGGLLVYDLQRSPALTPPPTRWPLFLPWVVRQRPAGVL
jgi:hypothetical protein